MKPRPASKPKPRSKSPPADAPKRPKSLADDAAKLEVLRFRCTVEQKAALVAAAKGTGLDVSSWLRMVALREAGQSPGPSVGAPEPGKARP